VVLAKMAPLDCPEDQAPRENQVAKEIEVNQDRWDYQEHQDK